MEKFTEFHLQQNVTFTLNPTTRFVVTLPYLVSKHWFAFLPVEDSLLSILSNLKLDDSASGSGFWFVQWNLRKLVSCSNPFLTHSNLKCRELNYLLDTDNTLYATRSHSWIRKKGLYLIPTLGSIPHEVKLIFTKVHNIVYTAKLCATPANVSAVTNGKVLRSLFTYFLFVCSLSN